MINIQPLSGNVLIDPQEAEAVSAGGIIIPDAAKEKPSQGLIVALASDASDEITVGDRVIYKKFGGTAITHEGKDYLIVPDGDLLAKFVEGDAI
ncbi:MAG: co-chaperone GroES [Deltaproteobacteria bacterium]|nr:co-chaperone GroES [Deltaproteobacteria bacterium]MBN2673606.1 co-chaperone GroES [Deltaproteobacteria bacterium]